MHNDFDPITEMSMGIVPSDENNRPRKQSEKRKYKRKYSDEIWLSDQEDLNVKSANKVTSVKSENDPKVKTSSESKRKRTKSPKSEKSKKSVSKQEKDGSWAKEDKPKEGKKPMKR